MHFNVMKLQTETIYKYGIFNYDLSNDTWGFDKIVSIINE